MNDQKRQEVINGMIKEIDRVHSASTGWAIATIGQEPVSIAEIAKVYAALIKNDRYTGLRRDDGNYDVFLNPNYGLNENIKETNLSVQDLNSSLKKTNNLMVLIAAITGLFIAGQFLRDILAEQKPTYKQLEQIEQQLNSYKKSLQEIDDSTGKAVKDSLYAPLHRHK